MRGRAATPASRLTIGSLWLPVTPLASSASPESSSRAASGRYLLRAPVSLERLEVDGSVARYRHKQAMRPKDELFDRHDLLARLLMHIPAPRLHIVRYYGHYASAARARRGKGDDASAGQTTPESHSREEEAVSSPQRRRLRRQWARMIRRVYEADPLLCACGETMRVIAFFEASQLKGPAALEPSASDARWPRASAGPRFLTDPPVVGKILRHLEDKARATGSARAPPETADREQLAS
ncbi:MAG TPA: transposase [Thermoanaerobaculia bacterium]|nr:transposase [Thermoanaerobaculia bacterium]